MPKKDDAIWVALRVLEGSRNDGMAGEYCGRMSKRAFDQIRANRNCEPLFKLEDPFWLENQTTFIFLSQLKDHGYSSASYFRSDSILRLIPLTPAFVKRALAQMKAGPKPKKPDAKHERHRYIA